MSQALDGAAARAASDTDPNPPQTQRSNPVVNETSIPAVKMEKISITFPGVKALDEVDFVLYPGEVHSLMGENGAGKSTLIKALTGVYKIDSGTIIVGGEEKHFSHTADAQDAGIATVYQEVNLCQNLTVAENIMLGREPRKLGRIDGKRMVARARDILTRLGLDIDPKSILETHSIAVQQLVAIGRSLVVDSSVLILDEPTASLDADEVEKLFSVVRQLRSEGVAILFVSHFLDQVFSISDRMTVLRNGRFVATHEAATVDHLQLVGEMLGRALENLESLDEHGAHDRKVDSEVLVEATDLGRKGSLEPTSFTIKAGEVMGLAGLLGSGRTELARLLYGADSADKGSLKIAGKDVRIRNPRAGMNQQIAFSSESRRTEGIVGDLTVAENMILGLQAQRGWHRPLPTAKRDELVDKYMKALDIRPANPKALMRNLSGGNQQKVLLARCLLTEPRLLILDEPTKGIDVGAKAQIQQLVNTLANDGLAVVYISAELEEVVRLSDRIMVMRDHRKIKELPGVTTTIDDLMNVIALDKEEVAHA